MPSLPPWPVLNNTMVFLVIDAMSFLHYCRMYFKVKPDCQLAWSLAEQSADGTGKHIIIYIYIIYCTGFCLYLQENV